MSQSLVGAEHLIGKIYFPQWLLPIAAMGHCLSDFLLALILMVGWHAGFDVERGGGLLWVLQALLVLATLACGLLLAVPFLRQRELRPLIGFVTQVTAAHGLEACHCEWIGAEPGGTLRMHLRWRLPQARRRRWLALSLHGRRGGQLVGGWLVLDDAGPGVPDAVG